MAALISERNDLQVELAHSRSAEHRAYLYLELARVEMLLSQAQG
jgi:hypothetical protein